MISILQISYSIWFNFQMVWNGYSIGNANYHRRFQGKWHWQSIQFIAFFNPSMPGTQWPRVFGTCTATFLRSGWKSLVFHLFRRFWTDFFQKIRAFFSSALFCTLFCDLWLLPWKAFLDMGAEHQKGWNGLNCLNLSQPDKSKESKNPVLFCCAACFNCHDQNT